MFKGIFEPVAYQIEETNRKAARKLSNASVEIDMDMVRRESKKTRDLLEGNVCATNAFDENAATADDIYATRKIR